LAETPKNISIRIFVTLTKAMSHFKTIWIKIYFVITIITFNTIWSYRYFLIHRVNRTSNFVTQIPYITISSNSFCYYKCRFKTTIYKWTIIISISNIWTNSTITWYFSKTISNVSITALINCSMATYSKYVCSWSCIIPNCCFIYSSIIWV